MQRSEARVLRSHAQQFDRVAQSRSIDGFQIFSNHCRTSQTSAIWTPRPLPPMPAGFVHVRVTSPSAVASRGMSTSIGL